MIKRIHSLAAMLFFYSIAQAEEPSSVSIQDISPPEKSSCEILKLDWKMQDQVIERMKEQFQAQQEQMGRMLWVLRPTTVLGQKADSLIRAHLYASSIVRNTVRTIEHQALQFHQNLRREKNLAETLKTKWEHCTVEDAVLSRETIVP